MSIATVSASRRRGSVVRTVALCGLAAVLAFAATPAHAGVLLQVSGYVVMPQEDMGTATSYTRDLALNYCMDRGAALIADSRLEISGDLVNRCGSNYGSLCTTILDGSAKPPDQQGRTELCVEDVSSVNVPSSSMWCTYRWRLGFYDTYAEVGGTEDSQLTDPGAYNPGTCYFKCLYPYLTYPFCNGFALYQFWNASNPADGSRQGYPHGKFFTVGGVSGGRYFRADTTEVIRDNDPNPYASYVTFCYLQDYPLPAASTTRIPQPLIIAGYKELTWAQEHWWVIFLIIAAVLLALLIFLIIFCTVTSVKPKEQPPVVMMVQREREGHLYGELDDEDNNKGRELPMEEAPKNKKRAAPAIQEPQAPPMYPPMYPSVYEDPVDPEDLMQGVPRVFSQDDTMLTSENDSFAVDSHEDDDDDELER